MEINRNSRSVYNKIHYYSIIYLMNIIIVKGSEVYAMRSGIQTLWVENQNLRERVSSSAKIGPLSEVKCVMEFK